MQYLLAWLRQVHAGFASPSGEERGLTAIEPERPIQGEVAVIDTLRRVFLDCLRD